MSKPMLWITLCLLFVILSSPLHHSIAQGAASYYDRGLAALEEKNYYEAARKFNIALLLDPDYQEAISMIEKTKREQTKDYLDKEIEALLQDDHEASVRLRLKLVAVNPYESDFRAGLEDMYRKAIAQLSEASPDRAKQFQKQAKAWEFLSEGLSNFANDELSAAQEKINEAINHDDGFALAHLYSGIIFEQQGASAQARTAFQRALELDEDMEIPPDVGPYVWRMFCEVKGEPFPSFGHPVGELDAILNVKSSPTGADIYIDGNRIWGFSTNASLKLPPGTYVLVLKKRGYRDSPPQTIRLRRGVNPTVELTLEEESGKLVIDSTPKMASIFVSETKRPEITPTELILRPGEYTIKLVLEGYDPYIEKVTIVDRQVSYIKTRFIKQTRLRVVSVPSQIKVDLGILGEHWTPVTLDGIKPGDYKAQAGGRGYRKVIQSFQVHPQTLNMLEIRISRKSRLRMVGASTLVSGAGQYYGGRYFTGTLFLVTGLAAWAGAVTSYMLYDQAAVNYDEWKEKYNKAMSLSEIESSREAMRAAHNDAEEKFRLRRVALAALGTVWGLNVIHALLAGPALVPKPPEAHAALPNWEIIPQVKPSSIQIALRHHF